ncbi:MAG: dephospho-CoA kinase [Chitinivibrionia bacterium]|nr:dephospho-CoA kinase [Chitinivibrionia bacterium]
MIIGVSGYTGSGKSTVAEYLCKKYPHISLIDADKAARKLMLENTRLISDVGNGFDVVENGAINFGKLGSIVFENVENIKKLNSITFPYIIPEIKNLLKSTQAAIIDAPLLPLVLSQISECKFAIWVESDIEKRVERLQKRTGLDACTIKNRIQKQIQLMPSPLPEPVEGNIWKIVENNSTVEDLFGKIDKISLK